MMGRAGMRVVYISQDGCAPSGVSTYGYHVLRHVPESRMLLLNADGPPPAVPEGVVDRIERITTSESHDLSAVARRLSALLAAIPGPIVIFPNTGDTPWAATTAWVSSLSEADRSRVRVLGIVHSDMETQYAGAERHAGFAAEWVGVSARCAAELRKRLGIDRVHELHYPMDLPPVRLSRQSGRPLRLLYAGRLEEPQKRVSRLSEVFGALADRGVLFSAVVAGDGPSRRELEVGVRSGSAGGNVSFVGSLAHAELQAQFNQSDILLLTSAFEGLPLVLLEAMAAGMCPVVMETASGLTDLIDDGMNGCVVPQGDTVAMVSAIEGLDRDRAKMQRLGSAARSRIADSFSPDRHFESLGKIIEKCFTQLPADPEKVRADPTSEAVAFIVSRASGSGKSLAVYGSGMFGRKVVDACLEAGLGVIALVDSDPAREGWSYRGITCHSPNSIVGMGVDCFLVGSLEFAEPISRRIVDAYAVEKMNPPLIVVAENRK